MSAKDDEKRVNEYIRNYQSVRYIAGMLVDCENLYTRETARLKKRISKLERKTAPLIALLHSLEWGGGGPDGCLICHEDSGIDATKAVHKSDCALALAIGGRVAAVEEI